MTIAVDFDGTIVEHKYPEIGKELPFAIDTLKKLAQNGHKLILWTVRDGHLLDEAVEFCKSRGLEFYAVNAELPNANWSDKGPRKIRADLYIDDRNLGGVPDWSTIYEMVSSHLTYSDMLQRASDNASGDFTIHDGTYRSSSHSGKKKHHHHHRHRRRGPLGRLIDRCRAARAKFSR